MEEIREMDARTKEEKRDRGLKWEIIKRNRKKWSYRVEM